MALRPDGLPSSRSTHGVRRLRAQMKALQPQPCQRCGMPIDYSLPNEHPDSFELGHKLPVATHRHLLEDPSAVGPEHKSCNRSAGATPVVATLGTPSVAW